MPCPAAVYTPLLNGHARDERAIGGTGEKRSAGALGAPAVKVGRRAGRCVCDVRLGEDHGKHEYDRREEGDEDIRHCRGKQRAGVDAGQRARCGARLRRCAVKSDWETDPEMQIEAISNTPC